MKRFEDACAALNQAYAPSPDVHFYVGFFVVHGRMHGLDINVYFDKGDETWVSQTVVIKHNVAQHGHTPTDACAGMLRRVREHLGFVQDQLSRAASGGSDA